MLGIDINVYNTILMNSVEKDLDEKLWYSLQIDVVF